MVSNKNKDVKHNEGKRNVAKSEKKGGFWKKVVILFVAIKIAFAAITIYKLHENLTTIPELPKVNLHQWWGPKATAQDASIRPFRIVFSDPMLEELRKRFDVYRLITQRKKSITDDWTYGTNTQGFAQIFAHWQFKYTFRERERYLNKFNQFKTNIQGLDIHFLHVKPKVDKNVKVFPLLLLHGWPGSVREFYDVIPLLTTPRKDYDFVFEVIVPSLPGFIFSQAPTKPGLSPFHIAVIMRNLMHRLGFQQYYIQGGDFGSEVGSQMATLFPNEVLGFHTNFPGNFSKMAFLTWIFGGIWPSFVAGAIEDRMYPLKDKVEFFLREFGYMHLQATKPDTIGIALTDSPVGLASYILDKFVVFSDPSNVLLEDGGLSKLSLDALLDNIMLYWTSSSITTAMRLYKESSKSEEGLVLHTIPTPVPTWVLRLKHELIQHPDFLLRWKYPNLVGSTTLDFGGHFAALERPQELSDDVFLAVKSFLQK